MVKMHISAAGDVIFCQMIALITKYFVLQLCSACPQLILDIIHTVRRLLELRFMRHGFSSLFTRGELAYMLFCQLSSVAFMYIVKSLIINKIEVNVIA